MKLFDFLATLTWILGSTIEFTIFFASQKFLTAERALEKVSHDKDVSSELQAIVEQNDQSNACLAKS